MWVVGPPLKGRQPVGKVIAGMTMSLDGFVADADGNVDRLYADLTDLQGTPYMTDTIAETGAVIMGRKTFGRRQSGAGRRRC
jgi:dihydrofolate reductase